MTGSLHALAPGQPRVQPRSLPRPHTTVRADSPWRMRPIIARGIIPLLLCWLAACGGAAQRNDDDSVDTIPPRSDTFAAARDVMPTSPGSTQRLERRTWRLTQYAGGAGTIVLPAARAALQFGNGTVSGTTGCNRVASGYTLNDSSLTLAPGRSTLMACGAEIMAQEHALLAHWPNVTRYGVVNERLRLMDASGEFLMVFEEERPRALEGRVWEATSYHNGRGGVMTPVAGSRITAEFTVSGRVSGSSGCNTYKAGYATQADTLNFTPPESTEMMCSTPAGVMVQEAAFIAALQTVATYRIEHDVMEWRTPSGALAARFKAAE